MFSVSDALTLGVDTAGIWKEAEVDTRTILATLCRLAVLVPHALHLPALSLWVSLQTLRTEADRAMVGHPAVGGGGAASVGTSVLTLSRNTRLFAVAVVVSGTAGKTGATLAEVTLRTRQLVGTFLPASPGDTGLATGALRRRRTGLDANSVCALVPSLAVRRFAT